MRDVYVIDCLGNASSGLLQSVLLASHMRCRTEQAYAYAGQRLADYTCPGLCLSSFLSWVSFECISWCSLWLLCVVLFYFVFYHVSVSLGWASPWNVILFPFSASTLLVGQQEGHPACKEVGCWVVGGDDLTGALHVLELQLSPPPPSSLAPIKFEIETFRYRFNRIVLENGG